MVCVTHGFCFRLTCYLNTGSRMQGEKQMNNSFCLETLEDRTLLSGVHIPWCAPPRVDCKPIPACHWKAPKPTPICKPITAPSPVCKPITHPTPVCKPVTAPKPICKPVTTPSPVCKPLMTPSPVCKPTITTQNGTVTIQEGASKVTLCGTTVTINGKNPQCGNVSQVWFGDTHVNDLIANTSTKESTPVATLSNMTVSGFCASNNTPLSYTVVSGNGWFFVYDNATSTVLYTNV